MACNGRGIAPTAMLGEVLADAASGRASELPIVKTAPDPMPLAGAGRAGDGRGDRARALAGLARGPVTMGHPRRR